MSSLKDWKEALASGVSVKTLLGLEESTETKSGKSKKRTLQDEAETSLADRENTAEGTTRATLKKASDVTDHQMFEANLKVTGFLREPQQFKWSSFHDDLLMNTVSSEQELKPPVPVLPLRELLGPCFIGCSTNSSKPKSDISSASSEED